MQNERLHDESVALRCWNSNFSCARPIVIGTLGGEQPQPVRSRNDPESPILIGRRVDVHSNRGKVFEQA